MRNISEVTPAELEALALMRAAVATLGRASVNLGDGGLSETVANADAVRASRKAYNGFCNSIALREEDR